MRWLPADWLHHKVDIAGAVAPAAKDCKLWSVTRDPMFMRVNDHRRLVDELEARYLVEGLKSRPLLSDRASIDLPIKAYIPAWRRSVLKNIHVAFPAHAIEWNVEGVRR